MKRILSVSLSFFGILCPWLANAADTPSKLTLESKQSELRTALRKATDFYDDKLSLPSAVPSELWTNRQEQMSKLLSRCALPKVSRQITQSGPSRMWQPRTRTAPLPAAAAKDFSVGPNGAVVPSSGEFTESVADLAGLERCGIGFAMQRHYASFSQYDCGFGMGWNFSCNAGIVIEGSDEQSANCLLLFIGARNIRFTRKNGAWYPEPGAFLRLEVRDGRMFVTTPELLRYEFEPAAEQAKGVRRWRLERMASRQDGYRANAVTITYLPKCDRIRDIIDPYGERFDFAYDNDGHIRQVASDKRFVEYSYDNSGKLVRVSYAPTKLSLDQEFKPEITYQYAGGKSSLLIGKASAALKNKLVVEYDALNRVSCTGFVAKDLREMWHFDYSSNQVTVVRPPLPSPETRYSFKGAVHPSLPSSVEIPAQQATWCYAFNRDFLPISTVDPLAIRTTRVYDSDSVNVLAHGNVLREEQFANSKGIVLAVKSRGKRIRYHGKIAEPVAIDYFQIGADGKECVLKTESFAYSDDDLMPIVHDDGGIKQFTAYNRFGLPVLEWDANSNVTISYYGENYPKIYGFDFDRGDVVNGGPLVCRVRDAKSFDIAAACHAIGREEIFRNENQRVSPAALEELSAYDPYGNTIHSKSGLSESFSIFSSVGKALIVCDAATGITEYQYRESGRTDSIYHEFCPSSDAAYQGEMFLHFPDSRYFTETFTYDTLERLAKHQLSDESFSGETPEFSYERYPNGKVRRIVNPMGVTRVDEYDLKTGFLLKQKLAGGKLEQCLTSDYRYYSNGQIQSYRDRLGGLHKVELDGFGRVVSTVDAQGVKTQQEFDVLDRETAKTVSCEGEILSRKETVYSSKNQKLEREMVYQIEGNIKRKLVSAQYIYDEAGNPIAKRGVREGSWSHFLIDGLGNTVATENPVGDVSVEVKRDGETVYAVAYMRKAVGEPVKLGSRTEYDFAGRSVKTTPVDATGRLVDDRCQTFVYNAIGQKTETVSEGLTTAKVEYNSLGKALREEVMPHSTEFGERPQVTKYEYRADGEMSHKKFENEALALRGEKDDVTPELIDAPQETDWRYDELGRRIETEQPDGLIVGKRYNNASQPSDMIWTHVANTNKVLRHLALSYTMRGEVSVVRDGISGKVLREYAYDQLGNCTSAVDSCCEPCVRLTRAYDSLGNMISERTEHNGLPLPWSKFGYDLTNGETCAEWVSPDSLELPKWKRETRSFDLAARLTGISLDDQPFAAWQYIGKSCEQRNVQESGISARIEYTELMEPKEMQLLDDYANSIGSLTYGYGKQGQPIFASTQLGDDYHFSSYSEFDSFRRVVGLNGEAVKRNDAGSRLRRHSELFKENAKSVSAINTSWMAYDQANNIWGRYTGKCLKNLSADRPLDQLLDFEIAPCFSSPAAVIAGEPQTDVPDLALRELASNRTGSKAMYAGDCNMEATEQKYDHLGNLIEYEGTFWNGNRRYPVRWNLTFDPLGRLSKMNAVATKDMCLVTNGMSVAELEFIYDAENRRLMKRVLDKTRLGGPTMCKEVTLYRGNQQSLVYELTDRQLNFTGEYLWGAAERELVMAALPEHRVESHGDFAITRYFFQQDKGLNIVFTSKNECGSIVPVAAESYLGFGDNSTFARITGIESSMDGVANAERAFNRDLDEAIDARWYNPGQKQYLLLNLADESKLAQLTIWATKFPKNFLVFVLPQDESAPNRYNLTDWLARQKSKIEQHQNNCLAAIVQGGRFDDRLMGSSLTSPYRLPLRELKGNRILLVFEDEDTLYPTRTDLEVREFEVCRVADNPSPIAFAGQWLDRETGMYYQINRYRLAGSDKFISPDPIGFLDGNNLYAYAKGNPLEWHDPDGRFAALSYGAMIGLGAGVGAIVGGGMYALECWLTGEEFLWSEFAIRTAVGALSGAIAAATFGVVNPFLASIGMNATANIIFSSATAGFASGMAAGTTDTLLHGGGVGDALLNGLSSGGWGALGGAISGGVLSYTGANFGGTVLSGAVSGGIVGGVKSGWEAYEQTGDWGETAKAAFEGRMMGSMLGGVIAGAAWGVGRAAGTIVPLKGYPEHMTDPRSKGILIKTRSGERTYGGMPAKEGYQRQHIKPLSLGGRDVASNIEYMTNELHSTNPALGGGPQNAHPGAYVNSKPMGTIFY